MDSVFSATAQEDSVSLLNTSWFPRSFHWEAETAESHAITVQLVTPRNPGRACINSSYQQDSGSDSSFTCPPKCHSLRSRYLGPRWKPLPASLTVALKDRITLLQELPQFPPPATPHDGQLLRDF